MPRTPSLTRAALLGTALLTVLMSGCTDDRAAGRPDQSGPTGASGPSDRSGTSGQRPASAGQGVTLSAKLDTPTDITLRWRGGAAAAGGQVVEFATEPGGDYTILEFAPGGQDRYKHPDLMPETPFYYRLRAYGGPVSRTVDLNLPKGGLSTQDQRSDHQWAVPKRLRAKSPAGRQSVRGGDTAAPTALKVTVKHANGILLTWRDRARDEAGHLVEVRPEGARDFRVAAVLGPNIESTGLITLPQEKKASIRVRAFFYGERSNVVHHTTGRTATG